MKRQRHVAPVREAVDPAVFAAPPLAHGCAYEAWLRGPHWPAIDELDARRTDASMPRFAGQDAVLLGDGLHYEQRIAERGIIATRERNGHDLFNALVWLRYPVLKQALNRRQVEEVARMGPRQRSRPPCAMTHFDEAGVLRSLSGLGRPVCTSAGAVPMSVASWPMEPPWAGKTPKIGPRTAECSTRPPRPDRLLVRVADPALLALWDAHDWHGLFWRERAAWQDGRIGVAVFGHALLEHALTPAKLLVGKALVVAVDRATAWESIVAALAERSASGELLGDPLELRPLPLSGITGWHPDNGEEAFHRDAPCYQPLRAGRRYTAALAWPG